MTEDELIKRHEQTLKKRAKRKDWWAFVCRSAKKEDQLQIDLAFMFAHGRHTPMYHRRITPTVWRFLRDFWLDILKPVFASPAFMGFMALLGVIVGVIALRSCSSIQSK